jgi:hypothetical protein
MAEPKEGWLHITAPAAAAGTVASVLTYTLLLHTSSAVATGTSILVDSLGAVAAAGTRLLFGDIPATTVRILGRVWSAASETAVRTGGSYTSLAVAAAVGGTTALTVSLGSRLVDVTIKYGGALTRAAAERIATAYLQFKASGDQKAEIDECTILEAADDEGGWIVMGSSSQQIAGKELSDLVQGVDQTVPPFDFHGKKEETNVEEPLSKLIDEKSQPTT